MHAFQGWCPFQIADLLFNGMDCLTLCTVVYSIISKLIPLECLFVLSVTNFQSHLTVTCIVKRKDVPDLKCI
jgi:hypothetical protein